MSDCRVPMRTYKKPLGRDRTGLPIFAGDLVEDLGGIRGKVVCNCELMDGDVGETYIHFIDVKNKLYYKRIDRSLLILDEEEINAKK